MRATIFKECGTVVEGVIKEGNYLFVAENGKELSQIKYYYANNFREGLARIMLTANSPFQFIDTSGTIVLTPNYDVVESFSEGLAVVSNDHGWGCIDKYGKEIFLLNNIEFNDRYFSDGLITVRIKKKSSNGLYEEYKYGFMDKTGKIVIQYNYDHVLPFENGKAKVKLGNKEFYIDKTGKRIE